MAETITEFAPAKINLFLKVLGRRPDGYHDIASLAAFPDIGDVIKVKASDKFRLTYSGTFAKDIRQDGLPADNMVARAALLAAHTYHKKPHVHVHLTKNLPLASGIGGGTTDAAATVRALIKLWHVDAQLFDVDAATGLLGTDFPICYYGHAAYMEGVGDVLSPARLPALHVLLCNPNKSCKTSDIYASLNIKEMEEIELISRFKDDEEFIDYISLYRNDLYDASVQAVPEIAEVVGTLKRIPRCLHVGMSGSGATCFALFKTRTQAQYAMGVIRDNHPDWWCAAGKF